MNKTGFILTILTVLVIVLWVIYIDNHLHKPPEQPKDQHLTTDVFSPEGWEVDVSIVKAKEETIDQKMYTYRCPPDKVLAYRFIDHENGVRYNLQSDNKYFNKLNDMVCVQKDSNYGISKAAN